MSHQPAPNGSALTDRAAPGPCAGSQKRRVGRLLCAGSQKRRVGRLMLVVDATRDNVDVCTGQMLLNSQPAQPAVLSAYRDRAHSPETRRREAEATGRG